MPYVYAEEILLTGFVMNALILYASSALVQFRGAHLRRLAAAAFGAVCALMMLCWQAGVWADNAVRLVLPAVMAWIVTAQRGKKVFLRFLTAQWLTAFLCAGASMGAAFFSGTQTMRANVWVADAPSYGVGAGTALAMMLVGFLHACIQNGKIRKNCEDFRFCLADIVIDCVGFYDTGHLMRDPATGRDVVIVQAQTLQEVIGDATDFCAVSFLSRAGEGALAGRVSLVPFRSLGGEGMLAAFRPDAAWIGGMRVDVLIAIFGGKLDDAGRYHALLPANLIKRV